MARVLLVEDEDILRQLVTIRLELAGHEVISADNGKTGMEIALSDCPDLVLLDMHMPVMGGHEAIAALREADYDGRVLALTAASRSEENDKAIEAGCNGVIAKPIGDDFEERVAEELRAGAADEM